VLALTIALLSGSVAILVHSLFDFELHIPANAILFSLVVALTMSVGGEGARVSIPRLWQSKSLYGVVVGLSILLAIGLTRSYQADSHYRRGETYEKSFQWPRAIEEYQAAASFNPGSSLYEERLGTLYALKGSLNPHSPWNEKAIEFFQKALSNNPRDANAHINLAWLYAKKKEKKKALEHFRKAVFYDPTNGANHLAYANYCLEQSMLKESLKEFHKASNLFILGKRKADFKVLKQQLQQRLKEGEKKKR